MSAMLEFQNEIFLETLSEDGLLILAKGLGLETIFTALLKVYCDYGNLVVVVGANVKEAEYFVKELDSDGVYPLPKIVTAEYSIKNRQKIYDEGGVLFITSRILVVDLLMNRVPVEFINGIFIYKAHRVMESCSEAFILRLFRLKNKTGFIKAVSDSPLSFMTGFCHVARVMRSLFVKKLYIWPRFHKLVSDSLKVHEPDVDEIRVDMPFGMLTIQTAILDLIKSTLQELKRVNPSLDADYLTVENAISKSWHKILSNELDPVWHQLSSKTRQLVSDLKTLRLLLMDLCKVDCITFFMVVNSLLTAERALKCAGWMILDSADTLFLQSRQRIFGKEGNSKPEVNPKWLVLCEILKEIKQRDEENRKDYQNKFHVSKVLILTDDGRTALQLKEILTKGIDSLMNKLMNTLGEKKSSVEKGSEAKKRNQTKSESDDLTLTQIQSKYDVNKECDEEVFTDSLDSPVVLIESMKSSNDSVRSLLLLQDIQPDFIIMYDADISFIRLIEVWKASQPDYHIKVYFIMYRDSAEEQAYLTALHREKKAFESLIQEKATMVIPEYQDGKSDDNPILLRDPRRASELMESSSRRKAAKQEEHIVIVDMREFRCELPSLIHRRGIEVEPVTLEVGDYILTTDICVERKTLSDLIGSLKSGRLYNQVLAMSRSYKKPVLLIEFPHDKPFALSQGRYYLSTDVNSSEFVSKLLLLTLHFPNLRLLWSPGPYASAELFHEIKNGRPQPDAQIAQSKTSQDSSDFGNVKYNPVAYDFISKLPGITSKNQYIVMNKVKDIKHLLSLSLGEIEDLLQNSKEAHRLWSALHEKITENVEPQLPVKKKRKYGKKK